MNFATKPQLSKIHYLLNKLGVMDEKQQIILSATNGRETSSKKLLFTEARELIRGLAEYDPSERLKSLIFSLAYQANIIYGTTGQDKKINAAKLNLFLKERGTVKKELNYMSYAELIKTHRQFEAIVKHVAKSQTNKQADKAVSVLLNEMNLTTNLV